MDRISALRNVEDALAAFEAGEISLGTLEERVTGTLRTYVTDLEAEAPAADGRPYRVTVTRGGGADAAADGDAADGGATVVVADDAAQARERASALTGVDAADLDASPL